MTRSAASIRVVWRAHLTLSRKPADSRLGPDAELVSLAAGKAIGEWLAELEQAESGLLRVCGRRRLDRAFQRYLIDHDSGPALSKLLSVCSREDLESAAALLSARAQSYPMSGAVDSAVRARLFAFAGELAGRAQNRPEGSEQESDSSMGQHAERPTETLRHAAAALQGAKTPGAVARAVVEAAAAVCEAAAAVWWERREGNEFAVGAATGVALSGEQARFRPTPRFWTSRVPHDSPVIELSPEQREHAAFLSAVGAQRAVIVRVREGHRWSAALSVHDGDVDEERLDLLVSIVQQGTAALRALGLEQAWEERADEKRHTVSEAELALTSAVSLEELVHQVCLLAREETAADTCFVFLTEGDDQLRLRASLGAGPEEASRLAEDLDTLAAGAREATPEEPLWVEGARLQGAECRGLQELGYRAVLAAPLGAREQSLGAVLLLARSAAAFGPRQRRALAVFAPQAAASIEKMQLFESAQRRLTEMSDLTRVSSRFASTLDLDSIAQTVARAVANVLGAPRVAIFLADEDGEFYPLPKGQLGFPTVRAQRLPASAHIGAEALEAQSPRAIMDVAREEREHDAVVEWLSARSLLCAPMIAPQGLRGLLAVADDVPRIFDLHAVTLAATYANQAALAIQSAMLYQNALQHVRRLSKLGEVSEALAAARDPSQTADVVLQSAIELLDAPVGLIWLMEAESGELVLKAVHGLRPGEWAMQRLNPGEGLPGLAAQSGRPLVSMDVTRDGRFMYRRQARQKGLGAAIAAPLISGGRTVGVLNLYRKSPSKFTEEDKRLLMSLANTAAVAIENTYLAQEVQRRSEFVAGMMSEVNHRMRNSLQSVAGLLRMELERPQTSSAEEVVRRAVSHVQAVAAVHEVIGDHDLAFVDMKEAAIRVVRAVRGARRDRAVDLQVTGARVMLPSQKAVSVALVINELVDNALRHGLAGKEGGRITVSLTEGGGEVLLQVRDDGVGLSKDVNLDEAPGLGLKIVRGLIEQELGGKVEFESKHGFIVRARFPKLD